MKKKGEKEKNEQAIKTIYTIRLYVMRIFHLVCVYEIYCLFVISSEFRSFSTVPHLVYAGKYTPHNTNNDILSNEVIRACDKELSIYTHTQRCWVFLSSFILLAGLYACPLSPLYWVSSMVHNGEWVANVRIPTKHKPNKFLYRCDTGVLVTNTPDTFISFINRFQSRVRVRQSFLLSEIDSHL